MATMLKFQSVKFQNKENYVVYKTDKEFSHADENGKIVKEKYITKQATTLMKEGGEVMKAALTTLGSKYINKDVPQIQAVIAKACILANEADIVETKVPKNKLFNNHSETFDWYHHEITNVKESALSPFAMQDYFAAVTSFNTYVNENQL